MLWGRHRTVTFFNIKRLKFKNKGLKREHGKGHDLGGSLSPLRLILVVTLMLYTK